MAKIKPGRHKISVIVPVYNEIDIIKSFHAELLANLVKLGTPFEILYIDDNSTDGTYEWLAGHTGNLDHKGNFISASDKEAQAGVVLAFKKLGIGGKSYSLREGFERATGTVLVMIDGDLQYPPQAIAGMIARLEAADVVVADRQYQDISFLRKLLSKGFRYIFGKFLFGLNMDLQSGLKVFKKEVYDIVKFHPTSAWTYDLEFLYRAKSAGYTLENHPIIFSRRNAGNSKMDLVASVFEIGGNAFQVFLKQMHGFAIPPTSSGNMRGAGALHRKRTYITHTTLPPKESALLTFSRSQIILILMLVAIFSLTAIFYPITGLRVFATVLSVLYFFDALFNIYLVHRSLKNDAASPVTDRGLRQLVDKNLPVYSILCPLYKEANILPQFLKAISKLNWPKTKLDVLLLLEEDDQETIKSVSRMDLPSYVRKVIVPHSMPKTKPKACNYGLSFARGEFLVIYDAEDIPDPLQLKKAYLAFQKLPADVRCVQAKLNFYNPGQNLLTRFFTAEYSLWFDLTLTGLQSINSIIPLGGTSNHFRTRDLQGLMGWDTFNVTEDAELGVRLFKKGFKTAIIDSTTLEEGNGHLGNWIRQRSRWIKGYMQTYLVHTRDFSQFFRENGLRQSLLFHLTFGGKLLFLMINPFMWLTMFLYFAYYSHFGPVIELIYFPPMSYLAVFSCVFGNFFFLYSYMIACAKRNQWSLIKYVYLIPLYWAVMSYSSAIALYQLFFKPHFWEKTVHGLHLGRTSVVEAVSHGRKINIFTPAFLPRPSVKSLSYAFLFKKRFYKARLKAIASWLGGLTKNIYTGLKAFSGMLRPRPVRFSLNKYQNSPLFSGHDLVIAVYYLLFFSADLILARYLFNTQTAINYFYVSVLAKSVFVAGLLAGNIAILVFNHSFKKLNDDAIANYLVLATFITSLFAAVLIGFVLKPYLPLLISYDTRQIALALPSFSVAMMSFAIVNVQALNYFRKNTISFMVLIYLSLIFQLLAMLFIRGNLIHLVRTEMLLGGAIILINFIMQLNRNYLDVIENNIAGIFGLLKKDSIRKSWEEHRMRILIFNWRDTEHAYAGGAEVYVHELAKRWVAEGNKVTIFCGNDNSHKQNRVIDGVEIIRRGGTFSVYLFAFFYYILKFRGKYDLIIDCENGIPFFTPLYVRKPVILVIHHVHQEIVQKYLSFPLNKIAWILEGKLMPFIYKNKKVVTVSQSSKEEILKLGFTKAENIDIIHNGTAISDEFKTPKTKYPSFLYLGRLQEYKNIDVAIMAFSVVSKKIPSARLKIVGSGESHNKLVKLAKKLGVSEKVEFLGKVTHLDKVKLLSESWVALQPSQVEGWGITVIEANACATPVIASRVNGLRDSVVDEKTGLLVESGNIWQFASAMELLATDEALREKLSVEAHIWSRNFSWDKSAALFYALIGECLPMPSAQAEPAYLLTEE